VYYPSASGGNQSPIDIVTEDAIVELDYAPGANPLQVNYASAGTGALTGSSGVNESMVLVNTGNTARVNLTDSKSCQSINYSQLSFIAPTCHEHNVINIIITKNTFCGTKSFGPHC